MTDLHNQRMAKFLRAGLYVVTSQSVSRGRTTEEVVRACLAAGVSLIQLREKELSIRELYRLAVEIRRMTSKAGALFLVNDHFDIALAVGADGVHLGQDDLPIRDARRLAPDMIIGASSSFLAEARQAERVGASYVNIGPVFPTKTREGCDEGLGVKKVARIGSRLKIPFTLMGGIKRCHIPELMATGASALAVITAVTSDPHPRKAAEAMLAAIRRATSLAS